MIVVNDLMRPESLRGVRGFIFDCDGVLIDSYAANISYYNWFRERFDLPPMTPEDELYTHTNNTLDSFRRILPPERFREAMALRAAFDYREVLRKVRREPGLRRLLEWMRAFGFRLGINTSRMDTMGYVLPYADLEGFFRPVVTSLTTGRAKPDPGGVFHILQCWGLSRKDVAFIGDSSVDERTAKAAGVRFWSYGNRDLDAELFIPDYFALLRALKRAYPGRTNS